MAYEIQARLTPSRKRLLQSLSRAEARPVNRSTNVVNHCLKLGWIEGAVTDQSGNILPYSAAKEIVPECDDGISRPYINGWTPNDLFYLTETGSKMIDKPQERPDE